MHCAMHENMQLGKHLPNISHNNYAMTCAFFFIVRSVAESLCCVQTNSRRSKWL